VSILKSTFDRLQHGDALHELLPGSYWVRGQDDSATREYVFSQLRQSDKPKVVAICSSIGFVGLNIYCHHLINAAGEVLSCVGMLVHFCL
jgi:hypothetical protein